MSERPVGDRRLKIWLGILIVVVVVLAAGMVTNAFREVTTSEPPNPYEIAVPGVVRDELNGEKIAKDGQLRVITERCNTTDAPLSIDIQTSWVSVTPQDEVVTVIPGSPFINAPITIGGALCDPPTTEPILASIGLPPRVLELGGMWRYESRIQVYECAEWQDDPEIVGRIQCLERGKLLDQVGWFSENFRVVEGLEQ